MSRNGTSRPQPWLTFEDGLTLWRARDTYRVQNFLYGIGVMVLLAAPLAHLMQGYWKDALMIMGLEMAVVWGLRWLLRRAQVGLRRWWKGLVLVLVLSGGLTGCVEAYKATARIYGCDPVAVEHGYCTMPKEEVKR